MTWLTSLRGQVYVEEVITRSCRVGYREAPLGGLKHTEPPNPVPPPFNCELRLVDFHRFACTLEPARGLRPSLYNLYISACVFNLGVRAVTGTMSDGMVLE